MPKPPRLIARRLEAIGVNYLDAPVSGGPEGAANASLTFMVGGKKEVFEKYLDIFKAMGKNIVYIGATGSGTGAKLVNRASGHFQYARRSRGHAAFHGTRLGFSAHHRRDQDQRRRLFCFPARRPQNRRRKFWIGVADLALGKGSEPAPPDRGGARVALGERQDLQREYSPRL